MSSDQRSYENTRELSSQGHYLITQMPHVSL